MEITNCKTQHTPHPEGYLQHHAWMSQKAKSHDCSSALSADYRPSGSQSLSL